MNDFKIIYNAISEHLPLITSSLALFGIVIDITPWIKIDPVKALFRWIGKQINSDIKESIKVLQTEIDEVRKDGDEREARRLRASILDFANACRNGKKHTKDQFENIFRDHEDYICICENRGIKNGFLDDEFNYVRQVFHECQENNSFL